MSYSIYSKVIFLLFCVIILNLKEAFGFTNQALREKLESKSAPKVKDNKVSELEKPIQVVMENMKKEESTLKEHRNEDSSCDEKQDKSQKRQKEDKWGLTKQLDQNGKDLLKNLIKIDESFPDQKLAKRTLRLAKSLIKKTEELHESIKYGVEFDRVGAPPHGAKDLERNRSFVVLGLAESRKSEPSERWEEDMQRVTTLLDTAQVEARPIALYRKIESSPKANSKTPRPITVVMPTALFRRKVVKAFHEEHGKYRKMKGFEKLVIRRWLNKEQRDLMKMAKAEKKKREDNGEENLVIRNFKVVSKDINKKGEKSEKAHENLIAEDKHEADGLKVSTTNSNRKVEEKDTKSNDKKRKKSTEDIGKTPKKPNIEPGATHL